MVVRGAPSTTSDWNGIPAAANFASSGANQRRAVNDREELAAPEHDAAMVDLVDVTVLDAHRLDDVRQRDGVALVGHLEEERTDDGERDGYAQDEPGAAPGRRLDPRTRAEFMGHVDRSHDHE